jgi:hypothetical protein
VNEIRWIANHGSIDSQSLMASAGRARLLLDAAGKQLNHDISRAGHFLVAGVLDYRRNLDGFYVLLREGKNRFQLDVTRKVC